MSYNVAYPELGLKKMVKKGIVKSETAAIINNKTDELESLLNYKFWDK